MSKVFAPVVIVAMTLGGLIATVAAAPAPPTSDTSTAFMSQGA